MTQDSLPAGRPLPKPLLGRSCANNKVKISQPVIRKPQASSRRELSTGSVTSLSSGKQTLELENRLESSLAVAAGRITSLTKKIAARQTNPEVMKNRQLTLYITRLREVSEELKLQLNTLGKSSKLSNQQDRNSFDSSYQRTLALWREYRRVSGCVAQQARIWRQRRKESALARTEDSTGSSVLSNSSAVSAPGTVDDSGNTQRNGSAS